MVSFELGKKTEKDVFFCLVTSLGQRKNFELPWGIEPPRSDVIPLSRRDSTVSEVYYEVHLNFIFISHKSLLRQWVINDKCTLRHLFSWFCTMQMNVLGFNKTEGGTTYLKWGTACRWELQSSHPLTNSPTPTLPRLKLLFYWLSLLIRVH